MDKLVMTEDFELYSQMKKGIGKPLIPCFEILPVLCAFGKYYVSMEDAEESFRT